MEDEIPGKAQSSRSLPCNKWASPAIRTIKRAGFGHATAMPVRRGTADGYFVASTSCCCCQPLSVGQQHLVMTHVHSCVLAEQVHQHDHSFMRDAGDQALHPRQRAGDNADAFTGAERADVFFTGFIAARFKIADACQCLRSQHCGFLTKTDDGRDAESGSHRGDGLGRRPGLEKEIAGEQRFLLHLLPISNALEYVDSRQIDGKALTGKVFARGLFLPDFGMDDIPREIRRSV